MPNYLIPVIKVYSKELRTMIFETGFFVYKLQNFCQYNFFSFMIELEIVYICKEYLNFVIFSLYFVVHTPGG